MAGRTDVGAPRSVAARGLGQQPPSCCWQPVASRHCSVMNGAEIDVPYPPICYASGCLVLAVVMFSDQVVLRPRARDLTLKGLGVRRRLAGAWVAGITQVVASAQSAAGGLTGARAWMAWSVGAGW